VQRLSQIIQGQLIQRRDEIFKQLQESEHELNLALQLRKSIRTLEEQFFPHNLPGLLSSTNASELDDHHFSERIKT